MKRPKIDKSALAFGTPGILRDQEWIDHVKTLQCVVTKLDTGRADCSIDPSHIRWGLGGGTALKPPDNRVLPLLHLLHVKSHRGDGEVAFWRQHMTDELMMKALIALAEKMHREWRAQNASVR